MGNTYLVVKMHIFHEWYFAILVSQGPLQLIWKSIDVIYWNTSFKWVEVIYLKMRQQVEFQIIVATGAHLFKKVFVLQEGNFMMQTCGNENCITNTNMNFHSDTRPDLKDLPTRSFGI